MRKLIKENWLDTQEKMLSFLTTPKARDKKGLDQARRDFDFFSSSTSR